MAIKELIDQLKAYKGKPVILVGPPVTLTVPIWNLLERYPAKDSISPTLKQFDEYVRTHINSESKTLTKTMKDFASKEQVDYIDIYEIACNELMCPILDDSGQLLIVDDHHRSAVGGEWFGKLIRKNLVLERILKE